MTALEEYKQSVIWHVVTGKYEVMDNGKLRKRNASELKDSGVEWIWKIPKEWATQRTKNLGKVCRGQYLDPTNFRDDGTFPHLNGGRLSNEKTNLHNSNEASITISTIGNVGAVNWPQTPFWAGNNCTKIEAEDPPVCHLLLKTFESELAAIANTSAQPFIQGRKLLDFRLPKPPIKEKEKILSFLSNFESNES